MLHPIKFWFTEPAHIPICTEKTSHTNFSQGPQAALECFINLFCVGSSNLEGAAGLTGYVKAAAEELAVCKNIQVHCHATLYSYGWYSYGLHMQLYLYCYGLYNYGSPRKLLYVSTYKCIIIPPYKKHCLPHTC